MRVRHVIALDVGGTAMKAALIGADGALLLIVPAALGDTAGCLGAGLLARDPLTMEVNA